LLSTTSTIVKGSIEVEEDIVKALENITNLYIFPATKKVIIMYFDLKISKEQFRKFQEWLINKGFIDVEVGDDSMISRLLKELGYEVERNEKRHKIRYQHIKDKKIITVTYTIDDAVTIEDIVYFEMS